MSNIVEEPMAAEGMDVTEGFFFFLSPAFERGVPNVF